jgi:uncharacterized damage-inducible protein DinB
MKSTAFIALISLLTFAATMKPSVSRADSGPVNPDSVKAQMLRDWERAKAYTKEYIEAMPDDGLGFKPTPEIRSFAEQMLHLAQGTVFLVSSGTGKERIYANQNLEKSDEFKTKAALLKVVMESYDYAIDAVKNMDLSKSDEIVKSGNLSASRMAWINKAFEHQTHHRGQCTVYLRLKGVTPPNERLF